MPFGILCEGEDSPSLSLKKTVFSNQDCLFLKKTGDKSKLFNIILQIRILAQLLLNLEMSCLEIREMKSLSTK